MDKMNILLISTNDDIEKKLDLVEFLLSEYKLNSKIFLYTNKAIKTDRKIEMTILNVNKNELINEGLKDIKENVAVINLDYSLKIIKNNFEKILENYKDYDVINFKQKNSKVKLFFKMIILTMYNFILSLFGIKGFLGINSDFQYLSGKATKVMYNTSKTPNQIRLFDNFTGYNIYEIENVSEKIKYKKNRLFLILALILFSMVIISLGVLVVVCINHSASPKLIKVILAEILGVILTIILALGCLTYNKYINSI